jgi:hypothetical protein
MTKAEIKDLAPIPVVVIICLNPREARVEVLGMTFSAVGVCLRRMPDSVAPALRVSGEDAEENQEGELRTDH